MLSFLLLFRCYTTVYRRGCHPSLLLLFYFFFPIKRETKEDDVCGSGKRERERLGFSGESWMFSLDSLLVMLAMPVSGESSTCCL